MMFGISQRRSLFIILRFDRRFFLGADRLDIFLDLFYIRRPSHGVDPRPRACFVHDIDGLIRQETASNISIRKPNGCFQRFVGELGFVMCLVLRAQAFQNLTASSTVGASTLTVWNRRSSAASFSIYFLYSLRVAAPMHCSSPRLSAGLIMFEASRAPSAEPAPTIVCSSSMKSITFLERRISSITALIRSSNCPRYFVPATISARSSVMTRLSRTIPALAGRGLLCQPFDDRGLSNPCF